MKVRKLPKDTGPAAWNALLPVRTPVDVLEETAIADWLVIGAGYAGLAAARRLAKNFEGDRIVVLDAVTVGEGPAGRNSGFMIDLPHDLSSDNYGGNLDADRAQTEANRAAIAFALDAAQEYGLSDEAIIRSGKVNAAATEKGIAHNTDYAKHLVALGEDHEILDARQMRELTGIPYYKGGLFTPHSAMIQPAMFVRGVADGLKSNRVRIYEKSPVLSLNRKDGIWCAKTPSGEVTAPRAILAVNGHVENFGFFKNRLLHIFTYASMTRKLTPDEVRTLGGSPIWGVTPADPMGTTVRRVAGVGGDRIVVRNRFTCDPSMEVSEDRLLSVAKDHDKSFASRFPMLGDVDMEFRWGGRLCVSRNDAPAFGEVDDGLFAACCQNGLGTAKGTFSGVAAADLAGGIDSLFASHRSEEEDPAILPPKPLTQLVANARIRWSEHRAGAEL